MSFSQTIITHQWANADLTPASGSITCALTKRITNGGVSIVPASEVSVNLNGSGAISQALTSNADPGTTPTDSQWRIDVRVAGATEESYLITVPPGPGTVDLGTLLPGAEQIQ
ncbi:MAG: hypothetical protein JO130_18555 [Solirubrobacterales bacterium]|nr:hypothetical protein [Solirubrobacterales bacterium]